MKTRWRTPHRRTAAVATAATAALGALAAVPIASSADPSLNQLNSQLGRQQSRQQTLETSLSGLSRVIGSLSSQIALVQTREAAVQSELARDRARLAVAQIARLREQRVLTILRARLARGRTILARQLVSDYESGSPDLVTVVLESNGFRDLLERITYLHDAEEQEQAIVQITRVAKAKATAGSQRLAALEAADRETTYDAALHARALAGMNSLLDSKQAALRQAESVQQTALSTSRARSSRLEGKISRIEAEQAAQRAAAEQAAQQDSSAQASTFSSGPALGPSGGWAIPYPIVLCESGGQDLPPNSAGASGYYQIMPATWRLFGGSGPAAYLASEAEQDAVASRIWNDGDGASNWECAAMVGIH